MIKQSKYTIILCLLNNRRTILYFERQVLVERAIFASFSDTITSTVLIGLESLPSDIAARCAPLVNEIILAFKRLSYDLRVFADI